MRLRPIAEVWESLPMMRALLPFMAGILLAGQGTLPMWMPAAAVFVCGVTGWLLRSTAATAAALLFIGFGEAQYLRHECGLPMQTNTLYALRIGDDPAEYHGRTQADARAVAWRDPGTGRWYAANDLVRIRTDSGLHLTAGEQILCRGTIRPFRGGSESYRRTMRRRGFAGTLWLNRRNLLEEHPAERPTIHAAAVGRIRRLSLPEQAEGLMRAMAAGDRSALSPEQRRIFSQSGLAHLLAVSGLHTGLLFFWLNLLFCWMIFLRRGHLIRGAAVGAAIWFFVAAAGFPASALRAAILCTLWLIAQIAGRRHIPLNMLAGAAFVLLLCSPSWIGDLGFQLSFIAVAALMSIGTALRTLIRTPYKPLNRLLSLVSVGAVATLATAPLVAHTFGSVPLCGILITPIALLPASVLVLCGALWMLCPCAWLAAPVGFCAEHSARLLYALAQIAGEGGQIGWQPGRTTLVGLYLLLAGLAFLALCIPQKSGSRREAGLFAESSGEDEE